eukprot:snap_masked-scaffold_3-processed-gene-1.40-mRNA-1 protein AED:1.00 eAED:1.00 QI:0/-1/0/0/-1/1/1/0/134
MKIRILPKWTGSAWCTLTRTVMSPTLTTGIGVLFASLTWRLEYGGKIIEQNLSCDLIEPIVCPAPLSNTPLTVCHSPLPKTSTNSTGSALGWKHMINLGGFIPFFGFLKFFDLLELDKVFDLGVKLEGLLAAVH